MIEKGFQILVGDADGADKSVQRYLADRSYLNVFVYCMKNHCRNNVGNWPTRELEAPRGARGFDYYSLKDRAMAEAADYGFMLWDGKSKGTINNVLNLARDNKAVLVCVLPAKLSCTVRVVDDLTDVLAKGDPTRVHRLAEDLHPSLGPRQAAG